MNLRTAIEYGTLQGLKTITDCVVLVDKNMQYLCTPDTLFRESRELHDQYNAYLEGRIKFDLAEIKSNCTRYLEDFIK